ncbi:hypothetical protein GCM10009848_58020 [Micromonospora lupini]
MVSTGQRRRITRAGLPAATAYGGTERVTIAPAPMTAPRPMVTPCRITARVPTQTSSPIVTPRSWVSSPGTLSTAIIGTPTWSMRWLPPRMVTSGPNMTLSPIRIRARAAIRTGRHPRSTLCPTSIVSQV